MKVAVVGAGPAGVRAVERLVAAGLSPVWIDEAADGGGRIYQRPPLPLKRDPKVLYGFEAAKASALHAALDRLKPLADWRPETLVWHIRPDARELHTLRDGARQVVGYDAVILCTGAMDRVVPVAGWTTAGVTTLGAAQIALKAQGCAIGRRVAFIGSGPLLWLVAYQYAKAGADIACVLDTTPFSTKLAAAPALLRDGATFAKGLWYVAWLRARGIPIAEGVTPLAIEAGGEGVAAIRWRDRHGREQRADCDAIGMGWGLKPEAQLADLADVPFRYDEIQANWVPERDSLGRTAVRGIYLAGDGAGIGGAAVAEIAGAAAALAVLADLGQPVDHGDVMRLELALQRQARFRQALERAFPFPVHLARQVPDETILCRCEGLTAGELRAVAKARGGTGQTGDLNRAKAFTRTGMGRCQGRVCGPVAAQIFAAEAHCDLPAIGRLRGQPPVKPFAMGAARAAAGTDTVATR
ncbi:MAG: FAD-dependent oxidoreductase [Rhizobiales bacterium]|nr:FAD-dependent oxidoreductase [Hyphomicrobiales bacterium]